MTQTMSCQPIETMIPLFVEGDLPGRKAEKVRGHLEGCAGCRALAEGFRDSQRWLRRAWRAPDLGGAALDLVRRNVTRAIDNDARPPALWLRLERLWSTLRHFAASPAVAMTAVFFVAMTSIGLTRLSGERPILYDEAPAATADDPTDAELAAAAPDRLLAQAKLVELGGDPVELALDDSATQAADDRLRIEIRTGDPNVRIIWFSPQEKAASVEN